MLNQIIGEMLQNALKRLEESQDERIETFLNLALKYNLAKEADDIISFILLRTAMLPEAAQEEYFFSKLEVIQKNLPHCKSAYRFHVELNEENLESWREFQLPAFYTLEDLALAVLAAFDGDGEHLYMIQYQGKKYVMDEMIDDYEEINVKSVGLASLSLQKGNTLTMIYDFGENWSFTISFEEERTVEFLENILFMTDGEGYNIWEDGHSLLELLASDPQADAYEYCGEEQTIAELAEEYGIHLLTQEQIKRFAEDFLVLKSMAEEELEEDEDDFHPDKWQA